MISKNHFKSGAESPVLICCFISILRSNRLMFNPLQRGGPNSANPTAADAPDRPLPSSAAGTNFKIRPKKPKSGLYAKGGPKGKKLPPAPTKSGNTAVRGNRPPAPQMRQPAQVVPESIWKSVVEQHMQDLDEFYTGFHNFENAQKRMNAQEQHPQQHLQPQPQPQHHPQPLRPLPPKPQPPQRRLPQQPGPQQHLQQPQQPQPQQQLQRPQHRPKPSTAALSPKRPPHMGPSGGANIVECNAKTNLKKQLIEMENNNNYLEKLIQHEEIVHKIKIADRYQK